MNLGVVADVHGQGTLEDDVLHAIGRWIDAGEFAKFGDEARTRGFICREGSSAGFDDEGRRLMWGGAEADERAAKDLRVLAEGGLDGFRWQFAFGGAHLFHASSEKEQSALCIERTQVAHAVPDAVPIGDLREARRFG